MQFRLESIQRRTVQRCARCNRMHRVVVTFREIKLVVPEIESLPVRVVNGTTLLTVGVTCANKVLSQVPVAYLDEAKAMLEAYRASQQT